MAWLLDSPDGGQLAAATVQSAVSIAALVWAMFQHPENRTEDTALETGEARAEDGGAANTGIKRPGGHGSGTARAERTGNATATGDGSSANSGIDYS
ncbi:hypothetical protein CTZ27_08705 [Streptomyces griseocarneus]|nr:hypothetical protein CTZ27_08705 [Streptomyces griseocarneus]